jgi:hypothetical protein
MQLRLGLTLATLALPLAFGAPKAFATPYSFTSSGAFSDCSGCTTTNGGTEITWGGTRNQSGSWMTAVPLSTAQTGTTPAAHDQIGELQWYNASTDSSTTASTVTADYKLTLNFSQPTPGGKTSETFDVTIINTPNNAKVCFLGFFCSNTGDVDDTASLTATAPSVSVDGLLLSNFQFSVDCGTYDPATGLWSNPEGNISDLKIYADITNTPVPEPATIGLLGTGLLGLGIGRRRSRTAGTQAA